MGKAYDALSSQQKARYDQWLSLQRLDHSSIQTFDQPVVTTAGDQPTVLSSNPEASLIPPILRPVSNVAELKRLGGVPDSLYEAEPNRACAVLYPETFAPERLATARNTSEAHALADLLAEEDLSQIDLAFRAYMLGHSAHVQEYEPLIDTLNFPMQCAIFAGDSIVVSSNSVLEIESPDNQPVLLIYAKITIERGGQIVVKTTGKIQTVILEKQS